MDKEFFVRLAKSPRDTSRCGAVMSEPGGIVSEIFPLDEEESLLGWSKDRAFVTPTTQEVLRKIYAYDPEEVIDLTEEGIINSMTAVLAGNFLVESCEKVCPTHITFGIPAGQERDIILPQLSDSIAGEMQAAKGLQKAVSKMLVVVSSGMYDQFLGLVGQQKGPKACNAEEHRHPRSRMPS